MAKTIQSYLKDSPELINKVTEHAYTCNISNAELLRVILREQIKAYHFDKGNYILTGDYNDDQIIQEVEKIGKQDDRKVASVLRVLLNAWMIKHEDIHR